ncbi:MAG TPA: hypothetical protein VFN14_00475 [Candidatus Limnocylindria bacterium]|nr:hypothetical protein [Candidatus Limnocylindria bacterium]
MTADAQRNDPLADDAYVPGRCNIGPAEIARRRMVGHIGLAGTIVGFVILVLLPIHPLWRLLLFFPASVSASGYLQAALHFCAGFGSRGIFNFGQLGQRHEIIDPESLARDRAMSNRIGLTSGLVGMIVAIVAVLLPF